MIAEPARGRDAAKLLLAAAGDDAQNRRAGAGRRRLIAAPCEMGGQNPRGQNAGGPPLGSPSPLSCIL